MNERSSVIAPPPLIHVLIFAAGAAIDWLVGWSLGADQLRWITGAVLIVAGSVFVTWAIVTMMKARTTVNPYGTSSRIVSNGVFSISRNPIYLGLALGYAGVALFLPSPGALLLLPLLVFTMNSGVIVREERYLEGRFGEEYRQYLSRVRRWI